MKKSPAETDFNENLKWLIQARGKLYPQGGKLACFTIFTYQILSTLARRGNDVGNLWISGVFPTLSDIPMSGKLGVCKNT